MRRKPETCLERSWNLRISSPCCPQGWPALSGLEEAPQLARPPAAPKLLPNPRDRSPPDSLSSERSRAHLFHKRSAEKQDALLWCNRVLERRKVPSAIPFSVGLCSHHHLLPPRSVGWLPWYSAFSYFVFWCVELNPHLCSRTQRFCRLLPRLFGNPSLSPARREPQSLAHMLTSYALWPRETWSLCRAVSPQQWCWSARALRRNNMNISSTTNYFICII